MEDRELRLASGWLGVFGVLTLLGVIVALIVLAAQWKEPMLAFLIVPLAIVWLVSIFGFIVNGPNQSRVVQLFGKYIGTLRETGFFYGNPFYWRTRPCGRWPAGTTTTPRPGTRTPSAATSRRWRHS